MANQNRYTKDQIAEALDKAGGFVSHACRLLDCTRKTLYNYINKYPELKEIRKDIRESYLDIAESKLMQKVRDGATPELLFYLKTQGKARGYIEKSQLDLTSGDEQINKIEIEIFENKGNESSQKKS